MMIDHISTGNYFDVREEETTPEELRDMAYNTISVLVLAIILLSFIVLPCII